MLIQLDSVSTPLCDLVLCVLAMPKWVRAVIMIMIIINKKATVDLLVDILNRLSI